MNAYSALFALTLFLFLPFAVAPAFPEAVQVKIKLNYI
jgi:hypothetical protein